MKVDFNPNIQAKTSFGKIKMFDDEVKAHIERTFSDTDKLCLEDCMFVQDENPATITLMKRNKKYLKAVIHNPIADKYITLKQNRRLSNYAFINKMCEIADNIWFLKKWR